MSNQAGARDELEALWYMCTIKHSHVSLRLTSYTSIFVPPFPSTVAAYKRKKVHDSALRLLSHPSTEVSSSHNKKAAAKAAEL